MKTYMKLWCSSCRATDVPLLKWTKKVSKNHIYQYHLCRSCNNRNRKEYYSRNKEKCREILSRSIEKHSVKQEARVILNRAVKSGEVDKPTICESCLTHKKRLEAHHTNYLQPLMVTWLCSDCHADTHAQCGIM